MPSSFKNLGSSGTGAIKLPVGTDAQQPGSPAQGMLRYNSTQGRTELYDSSVTDFISANLKGVVATGGTTYDIDSDGQPYRVHVFTSDGTFTVTKGGEVEYLVVAGGGGGGERDGGGGGAGELKTGNLSVNNNSYSIAIGQGGAGATAGGTAGKGENSSLGIGNNLISNSNFTSDLSGWTQTTGSWSVSSGRVTTTSTAASLDTPISTEIGQEYIVMFTLISNFVDSQNGVYVRNSDLSSQGTELRVQNGRTGDYAFHFTATETTHYIRLYHGSASGTITFDNVYVYKTAENVISLGGGRGESNLGNEELQGGNGGGGQGTTSTDFFGFATGTGNGNNGATGFGNEGGGGGGAGRTGGFGDAVAGFGGPGLLTSITGLDLYYAGGGAGGGEGSSSRNVLGGVGGGGRERIINVGEPGTPNTGGGGAGSNADGAAGGSGIVVVRYPLYNRTQPGTSLKDVTDGCILDMDFANPRVYKGIGVVADSLGRETGTVNGAVEFADPRTHRSNFNFTNGDSTGQRIDVVRRNGSPWISNSGTLMFWLYADNRASANTYEEIIGVNTYTGDNDGWRFYRYDTTGIRFWETQNQISDSTLGRIIVDEWHHYAMTRDGSTVKIYRDGVQIGNNYTASITNWTGSTLHIGGTYATSLNGDLGIVRVYDRPLSASELLQHFNFTKWRFGY